MIRDTPCTQIGSCLADVLKCSSIKQFAVYLLSAGTSQLTTISKVCNEYGKNP